MNNGALNFDGIVPKKGHRLQYVEVFNWGTFNKRVWRFTVNGDSALLTGENGAGKSTMIDAMATLLVPNGKIKYNGKPKEERNLLSYVMGYYKTASGESNQAENISLRGMNDYSVILAVFANDELGEVYTIAQVLRPSDTTARPKVDYFTAEHALSVEVDFANFGTSINQLIAKLKGVPDVTHYREFSHYSAAFRSKLCIESPKTMALFGETVSMKEVPSITNFLRKHMLDDQDNIDDQITAIITSFRDLEESHEAVLAAKRKIELIKPITINHQEIQAAEKLSGVYQKAKEAIPAYFMRLRIEELKSSVADYTKKHDQLLFQLNSLTNEKTACDEEYERIHKLFHTSGGGQLESMEAKVKELKAARIKIEKRLTDLNTLLRLAGFSEVSCEKDFLGIRNEVAELVNQEAQKNILIEQQYEELAASKSRINETIKDTESEIKGLEGRKSNIDNRHTNMRDMICDALGMDSSSLPYAAELIQVKEKEAPWRGAIERVLFEFGNSMLVPPQHYKAVSQFINAHNLQRRLVFFETSKTNHEQMGSREASMLRKLDIKDDPLAGWLRAELNQKFNYVCVNSLAEYQIEDQGLTIEGMYKKGKRNVKDDRNNLNDSSKFILGWSNLEKIEELKFNLKKDQVALQKVVVDIEALKKQQAGFANNNSLLNKLNDIEDFTEIDLVSHDRLYTELENKMVDLRAASDKVAKLEQQLKDQKLKQGQVEKEITGLNIAIGGNEHSLTTSQAALEQEQAAFALIPEYILMDGEIEIEKLLEKEIRISPFASLAAKKDEAEKVVYGLIRKQDAIIRAASEAAIQRMGEFKHEFSHENENLDGGIHAIGAYVDFYNELVGERVHELEEAFRNRMKDQASKSLVMLRSDLDTAKDEVEKAIAKINKLISSIDYSAGHYIVIKAHLNNDPEILEFKRDLQDSLSNSIDSYSSYEASEIRFAKVKKLISRLKGRPDTANSDREWRTKVTDVRHWFDFAAQELRREDDSEVQLYCDSNSKSNGQKEKLAYTILAASLAHQYGLDKEIESTYNFRLIIIDEAFSAASPDNTQYGLELLKRLNFQMLVATPMIKIDVIEPFVQHVGHVANNADKNNSSFINMTIENYRKHPAYIAARKDLHEEAAA